MRIATWNINSVRLRIQQVLRFVKENHIDVLCLQETLIIIFNISLVNLLLIEAVILISSIFHHSNINLPKKLEKALSFIIVTPSIHWVHHHKRQSETDANYSTIFSWWDKIFDSKSNFTRKVGMPIGVQGDREQDLLNLILRPIKK